MKRCYADLPEATEVKHMFDVKSWLAPFLLKIHNHSHPHIFRFRIGTNGSVEMHYKEWSESPWQPTESGIQLFQVHYYKIDCYNYSDNCSYILCIEYVNNFNSTVIGNDSPDASEL